MLIPCDWGDFEAALEIPVDPLEVVDEAVPSEAVVGLLPVAVPEEGPLELVRGLLGVEGEEVVGGLFRVVDEKVVRGFLVDFETFREGVELVAWVVVEGLWIEDVGDGGDLAVVMLGEEGSSTVGEEGSSTVEEED